MNAKRFFVIPVLAAVLVCGIMMPSCAQRKFELTALEDLPAPDADGWITLFDGKTMDGWRKARRPEGPHNWQVEDGVMTNGDEHGVDLATVANFKDFELQIEYKTTPGGNSGVYLRGRVEVQILDSHGKETMDKGDAGAVYDQYAPLVNASTPPGEWNKFDIRYEGDRLTVKLNDQLVQDNVVISSETGGALRRGVNEPGPIMLQGDHGRIWFRNVRIKPI